MSKKKTNRRKIAGAPALPEMNPSGAEEESRNTGGDVDDAEEPRNDEGGDAVSKEDEQLLEEIRDDYRYYSSYWKPNRDEMEKDMAFMATKFWSADELIERAGRPCLCPDELSQYTKQTCNNLRQNQIEGKVIPRGNGASDQDAERREAILRAIQHASNAQGAYTRAHEACVESSMGFWRITTQRKKGGKRGELEPRIKSIANQFSVLPDPNAKEPDFSDSRGYFVLDKIRKTEFARIHPNARKKSFSLEDSNLAPDWFDGEDLVLAEYWRRDTKKRTRMQVNGDAGEENIDKDDYKTGDKREILNSWDEEEHTVTQYITNGVEILEKNKWPGSWIPIIGVFGEEIYVVEGGTTKRIFLSLIRRARDPQKMLAYIASQEAEEFGMAPRNPFMIYEGQEQADKMAWDSMHKVPRNYVKIKPVYSDAGELLPPPTRQPFIPNADAYQVSRESWRRAVQAAIGNTPLPSAAQRQNEKSGVALEKIQNAEAVGSYHFTDNYKRGLENSTRQLNELITKVLDTPQEVGIRKSDGSHGSIFVTTKQHGLPDEMKQRLAQAQQLSQAQQQPQQPGMPPQPQPQPQMKLGDANDYLIIDQGEFDVTVTTGPTMDSEREAQSEFVDTLLQEAGGLMLPQPIVQKIVAMAVKMKNVGPIGEQIVELLDPPDPNNISPQAQAQIAQMQGQMQQMTEELKTLAMEKQAKIVEYQHRLQEAQEKNASEERQLAMKLENALAVAEIQTKAQNRAAVDDMMKQFHDQAHDVATQAVEHAHQQQIQQQQQQGAADQQQGQQAHEQTMATQAQQAAAAQQEQQPEAGQ